MDWLTDWLLGFVSRTDNPVGLVMLAGSAALEYVVPPFPGDTITLFGAILITAYGWSFAKVFGAVMLGSVAGSMIAFYLGHRLRIWRSRRPRKEATRRAVIDRLVPKFEQHGAAYLIINRFLPGIRTLFFVAAGLSGMRPVPVVLYSTLSAAVWNLGLIAVGSFIGASFDTLLAWVRRYTTVVWILIAAFALYLVGRALWRRRRRAAGGQG